MKLKFFQDIPLVVSLLVLLAIASTEIPLWASMFSLLFVVWRFLYEKFNWYKLPPKITPIFGLMFFIIVYIQHKTIFGQEESITILVGLTAITILNFETTRDLKFIVLLGFLMVVLKSVFSLDFFWVIPALFSYFGLWLTLLDNAKVEKFRYLGKVVLRSVPLLVLLFILFPRLVLFQVNKNMSRTASIGFSEEMTPGRFTQIAMSDQMVFRAQFLNTARINISDLYWRGAVLNNSNGFIWTKGKAERKGIGINPLTKSNTIKYRVIQEPLGYKNIFVLDKPWSIRNPSEPVFEMSHSVYTLSVPQQQLMQFDGEAIFDGSYQNQEDPIDKVRFTRTDVLPPRTTALIEEFKQKYKTDVERFDALVGFFSKPGFVYTLNPDFYGNDLDEFLFVKKKGFCEHYAAAFGSMARALGIPARVVIGYHGGSYNEISDFWKFSQKDAHAWVEVGLEGRWQRVDPTGLVAPLRLSMGSEEYFSLPEEERLLFSKEKNYRNDNAFRSAYLKVQQLVDSLNYNWTMFLLNYDLQAQLEILRGIKPGWFFMIFVVLIIIFIGYVYIKRGKSEKLYSHQLQSLMIEIEKWAKNQKLDVQNSKPPLKLISEIAFKYPEMKDFCEDFSQQYESMVYKQDKNFKYDVSGLSKRWKTKIRENKQKAA